MGWTRCIHCENVRHDFVAWTFFTNCSSSAQIAPSFVQYRNDPKCTETLRNKPKKEFIVQWTGLGAFIAKMSDTTLWHVLFSVMAPVQPKLHRVSQSNETVPDAPKHYETHQEFRVQWSRPGAFVVKMFDTTSWHELFSLTAPVLAKIAPSFV